MARRVVVTVIDDFDGTSKAEETLSFALDGMQYEIDLSATNAGKLRAAFESWTVKARRVGRVKGVKSAKSRDTGAREQSSAMRAWARQNGYEVSNRGRIQADVVSAYRKAHQSAEPA
ncbi:Lsr2 family protein [Nocardia sp. NPDC005978]|uniref:histone-like nucleoid-structuring protein Lsr2 n=1 Tax=Nocardia sp. NPDC005978 TaxID=3156725 RepID=UPI0033B784D2